QGELAGNQIHIAADGKDIQKIRYLYANVFVEDTAYVYNEYGLPLAPVLSLDVSDAPAETYRITATASDGGSVSPTEASGPRGDGAQFLLPPREGYKTDKVLLNGAETDFSGNTVTVEAVTEDILLEVFFVRAEQAPPPAEESGCKNTASAIAAVISAFGLFFVIKKR
ncbi:MAG: hypothetical protein LBS99_05365, partial [Clostridiales bacterium]|nr:hypothetical protein [Clostridiales bacterium]